LEPFFETGTEGVIWAVYEDGKQGYDGLNSLKDGDRLKIFASDDSILWEGIVQLEYKRRYRPYPLNPQYGQQEVLGYWVHGFQENLDPEVWGKMFFDALKAELTKGE
jgi:hypothetical protein